MAQRHPGVRSAAFRWGPARLALPCLLVVGALVPARMLPPAPADARDVAMVHAALRRALIAAFEELEREPAGRTDLASLTAVSLGDERVLAGVALNPPVEELKLGYVMLLGGSESIPDGTYELRGPTAAVAVDLVDSAGRVVATIPLDLPFPAANSSDGRWQRVFLTVARWLSQRLR